MMIGIAIVINIMEVFSIYLLYHRFIQKRVFFRLRSVMILTLCGILLGVGFHYVNNDIIKILGFFVWFVIAFKVSNLRGNSLFMLYTLNLLFIFFLQALATVATLLPVKDNYVSALLGESFYLILVILVYWKIPISKIFRIAEQNLVIKFMFFMICAGLFTSFIIFDFNMYRITPYILQYIFVVLFSGMGIYETASIIQKYTSEIPARYHEHDNIIAGMVSLYMTYGNDELREELSNFLEGYGKNEYADKLYATPDNEKDFLTIFLKIKEGMALEKDIKLIWDIIYSENKRVSKTDTIKIMGILLDNAIEHCDKEQEVLINIFITEFEFDVEVENPYKGSVEEVSHMFQKGVSSKKGSLGGHGLNNLWKIVNRLNGKIMVDSLGDSITFKVLI